jgi:hypothetical protein
MFYFYIFKNGFHEKSKFVKIVGAIYLRSGMEMLAPTDSNVSKWLKGNLGKNLGTANWK